MPEPIRCAGLYGIVPLKECSYLVLIADCKSVGELLGSDIYQIRRLEFVPLRSPISKKARMHNLQYISMVDQVASTGSLYFSSGLDLTLNLQALFSRSSPDARFFLNATYCRDFARYRIEALTTPVIQGVVEACC